MTFLLSIFSRKSAYLSVLLTSLLLLSACGGGGGGSDDNGATEPPPDGGTAPPPDPDTKPSPPEAARFLTQATFGPTQSEINRLSDITYERWLNQQMSERRFKYYDFMLRVADDYSIDFEQNNSNRIKNLPASDAFWTAAITGDDQLRQRVTFALSQIFVISRVEGPIYAKPRGQMHYYDMLSSHAFGNFRELLEDVTLHPMMGLYLSHMRSPKSDPEKKREPDENYAREVMQLFTIGVIELNLDGTPKLDSNGNTIPTYDNETVKAFARALTGWTWANSTKFFQHGNIQRVPEGSGTDLPMMAFEEYHDTEPKVLLNGVTLPAGQTAAVDLRQALDNLFYHPNVAPFIATRLIKSLVTSNPSPAYVERIALVFQDNGQGVRGDLGAVVRAILMDAEARTGHLNAPATFGKLREPVLRMTALWRAFHVNPSQPLLDDGSIGGIPVIRFTEGSELLGQQPNAAPSVFNFFSPLYRQPGALEENGLTAPEFQILTANTITKTMNCLQRITIESADDCKRGGERTFDWDDRQSPMTLVIDDEIDMANDPERLLDSLNLLLLSGSMSPAMRQTLIEHLNSIEIPQENRSEALTERVNEAIFLIVTSPEFSTQR